MVDDTNKLNGTYHAAERARVCRVNAKDVSFSICRLPVVRYNTEMTFCNNGENIEPDVLCTCI